MGKSVLAVDDSKTMRDMVSFTLRGAGYTVYEAEHGVAALKLLQGQKVDVVITDVNMPEMDGITLTRRIRGLPTQAGTPILILTTESDQSKKDEGRAAGATGWIVKPFSPDKLLQIVAKVCP
ncbi:MAG TPA: response regulator [Magnetospirillum sp.]|jgi:two-component system chemotaxis response regulator CheY|nr:response regulator [Magnetospirillum sp.]